jgi:hypothetical protein
MSKNKTGTESVQNQDYIETILDYRPNNQFPKRILSALLQIQGTRSTVCLTTILLGIQTLRDVYSLHRVLVFQLCPVQFT